MAFAADRSTARFDLFVAFPHSAAGKVEPAVTRAITKSWARRKGQHVKGLKGAIADA